MKLTFNKEDNKWYIDLPNYPGDKADLQMVLGADTLLDKISNNTDTTSIFVQLVVDDICDSDNKLTKYRELTTDEGGGAIYFSEKYKFELWLCDVTKFVFGYFPNEVFYNVI